MRLAHDLLPNKREVPKIGRFYCADRSTGSLLQPNIIDSQPLSDMNIDKEQAQALNV